MILSGGTVEDQPEVASWTVVWEKGEIEFWPASECGPSLPGCVFGKSEKSSLLPICTVSSVRDLRPLAASWRVASPLTRGIQPFVPKTTPWFRPLSLMS